MHDPLTVAFQIPRPWPQRTSVPAASALGVRWQIRLRHDHTSGCEDSPPHREGTFPWWKPGSYSHFWRLAGRDFYWPALITIWHREPGGRDSGEVCEHYTRRQLPDGTWTSKVRHRWRFHVHHWRIQVPPLQELRRRLLTRCAWCGGRSRKGDAVNVSHSWDGKRSPWWRGERGLFHMDCSSVERAHQTCLCDLPILDHDGWGTCARCGKFRAYGERTPEQTARLQELAAIPAGARRP